MKIVGSLVFFAIFSLAGPGIALAGPPPGALTDKDPQAYNGLTSKDIERMIKDIGHEESTSKGMIKAALIISQPIDKVYALQAQDWRQAEYVPYLEKMWAVQKYADGNLDEEELKILFVTLRFRVRWYHEPGKYAFHWNLDPGFKNDLKRLEGVWQFYYIDDNHTLGRYATVSETGFGIPQTIQDFLTRRDLPEALNNNKLWFESMGTWRRPGYKEQTK
jgi:hypothetical protein